MPGRVSSIRAARENEDWPGLRTHAHQLKGIAGTFGYPDVSRKAAEIDLLLKQDQHENLDPFLDDLYRLCNQAIEHFEQCWKKGNP